jgi:ribulose-5-phosphate 4-epimerase/fuculose-1-phosphate aldolase
MTPEIKELLQGLFTATQILVNERVLDGFGHVSVRSTTPTGDHYFMIRDNICEKFDENDFVELDLESNPIGSNGPRPSIERFIHGEIYKARPDVNAIVHTHSPTLIPFGTSSIPLRPLYHMCGFLHGGVPVFEIRDKHGMTDLLITSSLRGRSLAESLNKSSVVLMRGHGATVVGTSIQEVVFRSVYATTNAQMQPVAMQLGSPRFLSSEEAALADELHGKVLFRPWDFWKSKLKAET